ncbi:hypothetical protein [Phytohabitans rumicis]|uniref:Uncharacterized protein n=1 Tax=Phytohabitans rumicis TaxID=1076125 RepID=A0A6V8L2Q4_9ACTN|nr:hypothetical protein [Phytohabitans rumicis]GFJ91582.1 hypothetical protein Prum_052240 [Phytohabitans rumicis]
MPNSHGRFTVVILAGNNLSQYCDDSDWTRDPEMHKVTTYGKNANVYDGGLKDGTSQLTFIYDTSVTAGPRAVIEPLEGTVVSLVYRPEGTGAGKPQRTVNVFVGEYKETHPVNDYVRGTLKLQHSDDVVRTTQ